MWLAKYIAPQVFRPRLHQSAPPLEQARAHVGAFDSAHNMRKRRLGQIPRFVVLCVPGTKRSTESVHCGFDVQPATACSSSYSPAPCQSVTETAAPSHRPASALRAAHPALASTTVPDAHGRTSFSRPGRVQTPACRSTSFQVASRASSSRAAVKVAYSTSRRLVREGVERYDPSRPPRRDERSAAPTTSPSAPKRSAKPTAVGISPAALPAGGGSGEGSPKRRLGPPPGSPTSAPKCVAPRAERAGSADGAVAIELTSAAKPRVAAGDSISVGRTSTAKPRVAAGSSIPVPSSDGAGSAELTSAPKPRVATGGAEFAVQTSAAKSGKPAGRSIPAGVRREVWRRDFRLLQLRGPAYREALRLAILFGKWTTSFRSRGAAVRSRKT